MQEQECTGKGALALQQAAKDRQAGISREVFVCRSEPEENAQEPFKEKKRKFFNHHYKLRTLDFIRAISNLQASSKLYVFLC